MPKILDDNALKKLVEWASNKFASKRHTHKDTEIWVTDDSGKGLQPLGGVLGSLKQKDKNNYVEVMTARTQETFGSVDDFYANLRKQIDGDIKAIKGNLTTRFSNEKDYVELIFVGCYSRKGGRFYRQIVERVYYLVRADVYLQTTKPGENEFSVIVLGSFNSSLKPGDEFGQNASGEGYFRKHEQNIADNLTSEDKDVALSANQGKILKELVDQKASDVELLDKDVKDLKLSSSTHDSDITTIKDSLISKSEQIGDLQVYHYKDVDTANWITTLQSTYWPTWKTNCPIMFIIERQDGGLVIGDAYKTEDNSGFYRSQYMKITHTGQRYALKTMVAMKAPGYDWMISEDSKTIDSLNSVSTYYSLSANQGRVLKELIDKKADKTAVDSSLATKADKSDLDKKVDTASFDNLVSSLNGKETLYAKGTVAAVYGKRVTVCTLTLTKTNTRYLVVANTETSATDASAMSSCDVSVSGAKTLLGMWSFKGVMRNGGTNQVTRYVETGDELTTITLQGHGYSQQKFDYSGEIFAVEL